MQRRNTPLWLVLPPLLGLTAVVAAPATSRLYAVLLSTGTYALMQVLLPECRFTRDRYLCPLNWAMLLFLIKLVMVPVIVTFHTSPGVLPNLPERASMERALAVETVAYVAFCLAIRFVTTDSPRSGILHSTAALLETTPSLGMVAWFAGLGALGFAAAFGSIHNVVDYFTNPSILPELMQGGEGSWRSLGATVLRPFLAFSLILLWCRGIDLYPRSRGRMRQALVTAAVAGGIVLANLTFNFNRAAFVFPLATLLAVFVLKVSRISPFLLAALAAIVATPVLMIGTYRSSKSPSAEVFSDGSLLSFRSFSDQLQIYACGPQFLAYFLDEAGWGKPLYWGSTLVASAMDPVPMLGKSFRDSSGAAIYNRAIYGNSGFEDQIVPLQGELFLNFHLPGIVAGFFALGLLIGKCQGLFETAGSAFAAFAIHYVAMWAGMLILWSLAVFSQILVYFCWPIYVCLAWNWAQTWARNEHHKAARLSALAAAPHRPAGGLA